MPDARILTIYDGDLSVRRTLDNLASLTGMSRSELLRRIVCSSLQGPPPTEPEKQKPSATVKKPQTA